MGQSPHRTSGGKAEGAVPHDFRLQSPALQYKLRYSYDNLACSSNSNPTATAASTYITGWISLRRPTIK